MTTTSGASFLETIEEHRYKRICNAGSLPAVRVPGTTGYYCKFCGHVVPPGTRKYYCSTKCLKEMEVRAGFFRYKVLNRDNRTCQICSAYGDEVDHILPVCEGGGSCGLENLRTLCSSCHQKETQALRQRRKGSVDKLKK